VTDPEKKYSKGNLRKGSEIEELKSSKENEFYINNNNSRFKKRESNTSNAYKHVSDFSMFENKTRLTKLSSLNTKVNMNNLRIDPINIINNNTERESINNLTKNYWNNNNNNNQMNINIKNSPRMPNKITNYTTKKIGFSETNNNKFFSKIN